jgi:hypothetical protein
MHYNFMNIQHWIPGKSEKFPSPFPVPRRAPYGVTTSVSTVHSELQKTQVLQGTHMQCNAQFLRMKCYALKTVCYVQHISKKRNFHNGMRSNYIKHPRAT